MKHNEVTCDICGKDITNSGYYHAEHVNNVIETKTGYEHTKHSFKMFDICDDCVEEYSRIILRIANYRLAVNFAKEQKKNAE